VRSIGLALAFVAPISMLAAPTATRAQDTAQQPAPVQAQAPAPVQPPETQAHAPEPQAQPPASAPGQEPEPVEERATKAYELDAFAGWGGRLYPGHDPAEASSDSGGVSFALSLAYRSAHFVHPFLDVWFLPVYSNGRNVDLGSDGGVAHVDGSMTSMAISFGPGFEVWRARLRAGFAFYNVGVTTEVLGDSASSSSWHFGYFLAASGMVWRNKLFQVGLELRFAPVRTAPMGTLAAGITGSWDFARF
jgi:hypothetical protein